jgi:hypothetical protein
MENAIHMTQLLYHVTKNMTTNTIYLHAICMTPCDPKAKITRIIGLGKINPLVGDWNVCGRVKGEAISFIMYGA